MYARSGVHFYCAVLLSTLAGANEVGHVQVGLASWYGPGFDGRPTASGEIFRTDSLTAAHRELPLGCVVRVTNPENNLSVRLRINDRGPYVPPRIIDLSRAAAGALGMIDQGVAQVSVKILALPKPKAKRKKRTTPRPPVQYFVQVGAFDSAKNAEHLASLTMRTGERVTVIDREGMKIVRVGPFDLRDDALAVADDIEEELVGLNIDPWIRCE